MFSTLKRMLVACMFVVFSFLAMAPASPASAHAGTCARYDTGHWVSNSTWHYVDYRYRSGSYNYYKVYVYIYGSFWTSYWVSRYCP